MNKIRWFLLFVLAAILSLSAIGNTANAKPAPGFKDVTGKIARLSLPIPEPTVPYSANSFWVVRAYFHDRHMIDQVASWTEPWEVNLDKGHMILGVTAEGYQRLLNLGFRVEVDQQLTEKYNRRNSFLSRQSSGIPGFPCYRTVEQTYTAGEQMEAIYPGLAKWVDIGDSWEKFTPDGEPGYDLWVLQLTNQAILDQKPKLFAIASIHAREYATAELLLRTAEKLLAEYNTNPDISWLLDFHEIHLLFESNPDGRKFAEAGFYWRKNTNSNYCSTISTQKGADLNRNFSFQWGCCGGSSPDPCNETFRGASPASEPETQAIQNYLRSQYADRRPDDLNTPAPVDASGIFIDIHSYGELVLWPWGFSSQPAPNGTALQTLGRKLAFYNNYSPSQAIDLYATDGTTIDFAYGELGVASYTFEVGTDFFQDCDTFENSIFPGNFDALLYAAKAARSPYIIPSGPEVTSVFVAPNIIETGDLVDLSITIDDNRYQQGYGSEPVQNIHAAAYTIDTPPWNLLPPDNGISMIPSDGSLDSPSENFQAVLDTKLLAPGRHIIYFHGEDETGNWGAVRAAFIYIGKQQYLPLITKN